MNSSNETLNNLSEGDVVRGVLIRSVNLFGMVIVQLAIGSL